MTIIPFKKSLKSLALCAATFVATAVFTAPVFAQPNVTVTEARFSVDIKDATLLDALELVFTAAGNPSRNIDPAAKSVRLGVVSFKNQPWRDIVRTLTNLHKFRFSKRDNVWVVEPRVRNASTDEVFSTKPLRNANLLGAYEVQTRSSAQTTSGTIQTLPIPAAVQSNNPWTIIALQHSYAGFIAMFFQGGTVISTQETIVPSAAQTTKLGGQLLNRAGYDLELGNAGGGGNNRNNSTGNNRTGTNR